MARGDHDLYCAAWPWLALILLGAWHGLNPGMGWLFAVALGLQQRSRSAVFAALAPIALGHALAIGLVVLVVYISVRWFRSDGSSSAAQRRYSVIAIWKLYRLRHPTWVGMCVNFWDLTLWSWLMASAHGAGFMVVPVLLGARSVFCGTGSPGAESLSSRFNLCCHRGGSCSYAVPFICFRNHCLDRLRFRRVGSPPPVMDQS